MEAHRSPTGDIQGWVAKLCPNGEAEIDEATWILNIKKVPDLLAACEADMNPDTGRLAALG